MKFIKLFRPRGTFDLDPVGDTKTKSSNDVEREPDQPNVEKPSPALTSSGEVSNHKRGDNIDIDKDPHEVLRGGISKKRKGEMSVEVPRLGVSAENLTAQNVKIPVYKKDKASEQLIRNAIMDNKFLKNLDQGQVDAVVKAMYIKQYQAKENVITEGEPGAHLYVSAKGKFDVYVCSVHLNTFGPGKAFGELAILYNTKRNATIRVVTNATVWVLKRQVFQQIMMATRLQDIEEKVNFLRRNSLLKDLSHVILVKMSDLLQVEFFPPGHRIIKQGDKGDKFYMISGGSVRITKLEPGAEEEHDVGTFSQGKYFGELALLKEDVRQATVTALEPGVECLVLDRGPFNQFLGDLDKLKGNHHGITKMKSFDNRKLNTKLEYDYIGFDELTKVGTLGVGGFGRVELVQYHKDKNLTFALKYLKKCYVVKHKQEEHVYNEKSVMFACSDSPFICKLYRTYRDNKYIYYLMEACLGGDVFTLLQRYKLFNDSKANFVVGCAVEALQYMHNRGFVYRDLKPENLLLDNRGYVKIADFGFAKGVRQSGKTWTLAGTPEYMAPEIILNKGHDRAVDYWALGVLIYELVTGKPPFRGQNHLQTYNMIIEGMVSIRFPEHVTSAAKDLVRRLCRTNATQRLGYQKNGLQDIKIHKWFQGFKWETLCNCKMKSPIVQSIEGPTDISRFDKYPKDKSVPPDETSGWDKDF